MTTAKPQANNLQVLQQDLELRKNEFKANLPKTIDVDKFNKMVILSAVKNPKILLADRQSLLLACYNSATDGLMPDGRESAFVLFSAKQNNQWIQKVQYMPMISGIIKKLRNSGEVLAIQSHCVYVGDYFNVELGLEPKLEHKPNFEVERHSQNIYCVYAIALLKDGIKQFEVMTTKEINKIRMMSPAEKYAKDNNKSDPTIWGLHWEEMAKKTVMRRLSKILPLSAEVLTVIQRDDNLYDLNTQDIQKPQKSTILQNIEAVAETEETKNTDNITDITNSVIESDDIEISPEVLAQAEELFNK